MKRLLNLLKKVKGSGIVYVRNRRETQELARQLVLEGIKADFYHAGLAAEVRSQKQDDWKALEELMINLQEFDSKDPSKYDFALFGIGAFEK